MKSNKGQNRNIIIFREIFPGVRLKWINVGLLANVKMAAPERTGIIPVACGIFRAFLMNSEDHPIPERILPCTTEWCSLFGFRKYWTTFYLFLFYLAPPFGISCWCQRTCWKAGHFVVIQRCFCLASRSCFKLRTNDRAKHTRWKFPFLRLMRDFFFLNDTKYSSRTIT